MRQTKIGRTINRRPLCDTHYGVRCTRDCSYRLAIAAEARALQAARGCGVDGAYYLLRSLRRRERRKRKKLMESWRRAKWWRYWLRKGRVRHVRVHARHVVRARREEHEEGAFTIADIFGTDSEDEV